MTMEPNNQEQHQIALQVVNQNGIIFCVSQEDGVFYLPPETYKRLTGITDDEAVQKRYNPDGLEVHPDQLQLAREDAIIEWIKEEKPELIDVFIKLGFRSGVLSIKPEKEETPLIVIPDHVKPSSMADLNRLHKSN